MKVPIDYENDDFRDDENNEATEPDTAEPVTASDFLPAEKRVVAQPDLLHHGGMVVARAGIVSGQQKLNFQLSVSYDRSILLHHLHTPRIAVIILKIIIALLFAAVQCRK